MLLFFMLSPRPWALKNLQLQTNNSVSGSRNGEKVLEKVINGWCLQTFFPSQLLDN